MLINARGTLSGSVCWANSGYFDGSAYAPRCMSTRAAKMPASAMIPFLIR